MVAIGVALLAAGCATRPVPDFGGRWKPVNRYADVPAEIPLYPSYTYAASPLDKTLKGLLTRWAQASRRKLSYLHSSDFTLYQAVQGINTPDLEQAIAQLNADYAQYGIAVSVSADQITVSQAQAAEVPPAQSPASPDASSTASQQRSASAPR